MALEPGPIVPLELEIPRANSDPQEFLKLTLETQGELDEVDQDLGRFEETVFSLPLEAPTSELDHDLETVAAGVGAELRSPAELADADAAAPEVDQHIVDSTIVAPAEAFVPPEEFPEFVDQSPQPIDSGAPAGLETPPALP